MNSYKPALKKAIRDGDLSSFIQNFEPPDLECDEYYNDNLLHEAVIFGPLEIVRFLVEQGADVNSVGGTGGGVAIGTTALFQAARKGKLDIVRFLVDSGATIETHHPSRNPLLIASDQGHLEVVKYLLTQGIDPQACYLYPTGALANAFSEAERGRQQHVVDFLKTQGCRRPVKGEDIPLWEPRPERRLDLTPEYQQYQQIVSFMEDRFGPADQNGMQELLPRIEGMSVAINVIQPNDEHPFLVLFTNGMSSRPMKVPSGQEAWQYAELVIHLPADWVHPRDASGDPKWMWPVTWLREMAYHPHLNDTWLGRPAAIISSGEPPEPLGPNTKQTCLLMIPDFSNLKPPLQRTDGSQIHFFTLVPLYTEERDFELEHGMRPFLERLVQREVPMTVDVDRPSFLN